MTATWSSGRWSRMRSCSAPTSVRQFAPLLASAAAAIGAPQIRNRGTIGGNIMNAAACADTVPPLIALGATVTLQSTAGSRELSLGGAVPPTVSNQRKSGRTAHRHSLPHPAADRPERLPQAGPPQCPLDRPPECRRHSRNRRRWMHRRGAHRPRRGLPHLAARDGGRADARRGETGGGAVRRRRTEGLRGDDQGNRPALVDGIQGTGARRAGATRAGAMRLRPGRPARSRAVGRDGGRHEISVTPKGGKRKARRPKNARWP